MEGTALHNARDDKNRTKINKVHFQTELNMTVPFPF